MVLTGAVKWPTPSTKNSNAMHKIVFISLYKKGSEICRKISKIILEIYFYLCEAYLK